jgi:hypothetical protein
MTDPPIFEHVWAEAQAYRVEHEELSVATRHVAQSVAELQQATAHVGDHASAVSLREAIEHLQLIQAQLASAAERALSLGRIAARRAQQEAFERQVNDATQDP